MTGARWEGLPPTASRQEAERFLDLPWLAGRAGARTVIAAASTAAKRDFAVGLGVDIAIDYSREDWPQSLLRETGGAGPDLIYESAGGAVTGARLAALAALGEIVIYGALNIRRSSLACPS